MIPNRQGCNSFTADHSPFQHDKACAESSYSWPVHTIDIGRIPVWSIYVNYIYLYRPHRDYMEARSSHFCTVKKDHFPIARSRGSVGRDTLSSQVDPGIRARWGQLLNRTGRTVERSCQQAFVLLSPSQEVEAISPPSPCGRHVVQKQFFIGGWQLKQLIRLFSRINWKRVFDKFLVLATCQNRSYKTRQRFTCFRAVNPDLEKSGKTIHPKWR